LLIDSHCHIDFADFDDDRAMVIAQCQQLSINTLVVPGTQAASWANLLALSQTYPAIHVALGIHPYFLDAFQPSDLQLLSDLIATHRQRIVAVGEIGLDGSLTHNYAQQLEVFSQQLALASTFALPVILHHRHSHNDLIRLLKQQRFNFGGIIHAFSGSFQEAQRYIDLGFKLGIGGTITYQRAVKTRDVVSQVPLDSLVLETDAPDMPPTGLQGLRNSPVNLPLVLKALVALRQESEEEIIQQCRRNVCSALANMPR
jgi:TatD DNase family protein